MQSQHQMSREIIGTDPHVIDNTLERYAVTILLTFLEETQVRN